MDNVNWRLVLTLPPILAGCLETCFPRPKNEPIAIDTVHYRPCLKMTFHAQVYLAQGQWESVCTFYISCHPDEDLDPADFPYPKFLPGQSWCLEFLVKLQADAVSVNSWHNHWD